MTAPLPWHAIAPFVGCNDKTLNWSVWDADGNLVLELMSADDDGHEQAVRICTLVNREGPKVCAHCEEAPAVCFGSYEDDLSPAYACDECCGHGCEDGHCEPVKP